MLSRRTFSTVRPAQNFMSFFKRSKAPAKSTDEVMEEAKAGKTEEKKPALRLSQIEFIGETQEKLNLAKRRELVASVPFNQWLNPTKISSPAELETVLQDSFKAAFPETAFAESTEFPDLVTKFHFVKALQAKSGHLIPDLTITNLATVGEFKTYFVDEILSGKRARFNESEPEAIALDNITADNVVIVDAVKPKDQHRVYSKIVKEVAALEEAAANEAIARAKSG